MNYLPDRKVWGGGIAGVAAWGVLSAAQHYGVTIPVDSGTLATIIAAGMAWAIPPSYADIASRLDNDIVELAQNDPKYPKVTKPQ